MSAVPEGRKLLRLEIRNAETPRKIDGAKRPMLRFCSISLSTN